MTFVFIHGSFESPNNAWVPWLKSQLTLLGANFIAPQFTVDHWEEVSKKSAVEYHPTQSLLSWMTTFEKILPQLKGQKDLYFIGHSLGPIFTLLVAQKYDISLKNAYFIAPFFEVYGKSAYVEKANDTFYHQTYDFEKLHHLISHSTVIYSDNDPYIDEDKSLEFAQKLHSKVIKLHGLGHMNSESGMKDFSQLLDAIKRDIIPAR